MFSWFESKIWWIRYYFPSIINFKSHLISKKHLNQLYQYVDQIDTSLYKDFSINRNSFNDPNIYKLGCEMRDACDAIHRKLFKYLIKLFIHLFLESHHEYYFNILRMITICYHFYMRHEIMPWRITKEYISWMIII